MTLLNTFNGYSMEVYNLKYNDLFWKSENLK